MQFDFQSIVDTLQERLVLQSKWQRSIFYSAYQYIIRAIAYVLERYSYQGDVYQSESNWFSSSIREFLVRQAQYLSYIPTRNFSPVGQVWVSFDETELTNEKIEDIQKETPILSHTQYTGNNILFPKWTQLSGTGGVNAYVYEDTTYFQNTLGAIALPTKIGTPVTFRYIASGVANETIPLASSIIDNDEIFLEIVDTNDVVLFTINKLDRNQLNFIQSDVDAFYAEVFSSDDAQSVVIKFGDGVLNKKLAPNDIVVIRYAETNGEDDNVTNTGVVDTFVDTVFDVTEVEVDIFVTNNEPISDGKNTENLTSIKTNAPAIFNTGYRLGSDPDWETILSNESVIQKAIVWNNEDLGLSSLGTDNDLVRGTAVSVDGTALTTSQESEIFTRIIKEEKSVTERFQWEDLENIFAVFKVDATVTNQPESVITGLINTSLTDTYGILNVAFNTNIYESNFCSLIDGITPVLFHTTDIFYMEKELSDVEAGYTVKVIRATGETSEQIILQANETRIYVRRKVGGIWETPILAGIDISGTLTGQNGFTITGSALDYNNGTLSYTLTDVSTFGVIDPTDTDDLGYIVTLQYKTRNADSKLLNDLRLKEFYQITDVDIAFNEFTYTYQ